MFVSVSWTYVLLSILCSISLVSSFNLDISFPIIYSGSQGSYFGYTTALHRNKWGPLALVGAPRSNTTTFGVPVHQPGTLFRCNITEDKPPGSCQEVLLMTEGAIEARRDYEFAYRDLKDGMWLGVSLDVRPHPTEQDIVTCGHLWRNQYHYGLHLVNGVCYVINGNLEEKSVRKLLPLTLRAMQYGKVMGRTSEYNHAHGQAGMSAAFSEDGSNLVLGAPGIWSWSGSIVNYPVNTSTRNFFYSNPDIPSPAYEINFNSYFGYSVTTGKFFQSKTLFYAVGAPRDGMNNGKVYIIRLSGGQMKIRQRKQGFQLGEYFGATVLGVNLNDDSYTDLLVGAPLNSLETAGDEGKVYVFISNGKDLQKDIELTGDKKEGSRFGTALANIGDLNQDGFNDIAVGAPYEDGTGAVYIYHCSSSGVKPQYAQKIEAASINSKLSGFGIHISRGLDIDDNGYPDILVGSYSSSNVILLRSKPVIHTTPSLSFTPKKIDLNHTCEHEGKNLTCFEVEACLWIAERYKHSTRTFAFGLSIEDHRGFIRKNVNRKRRVAQENDKYFTYNTCANFEAYLKPNIKDVLTPVPVTFNSALLLPPGSDERFDKDSAVFSPTSQRTLTSYIGFQTGCGTENECFSDLVVSATIEQKTGFVLTLGTLSRLTVAIKVVNKGEPAYLSQLFIYLPPELLSINQDICETGSLQNNASLTCSLGNPLNNGTDVDIHIKLDTTKIPPHTKYLEISVEAVTLSNETYPDDNIEIVPLHLKTLADIGIKGNSLQDQIMHEEKQISSPIFTHSYIVRNHGPSPLQKIDIQLRVPYAFVTSDGEEPFIHFILEVDKGLPMMVPAVCEDTYINNHLLSIKEKRKIIDDDTSLVENDRNSTDSHAPDNSVRVPKDTEANSDTSPTFLEVDKEKVGNATETSHLRGHTVIECGNRNIKCITLRCSASPFINTRNFAQLSLDLQLNFTVLNKHLDQWYQIEYVTDGFVSMTDKNAKERQGHPDKTKVKTIILREGLPPPEEISPWIVFVSVGVGVALLLIILIILIKVGFFKRKEKDRMKEMLIDATKNETQLDQETNDTAKLEE